MWDPDFFLIVAKPDNIPITGVIFPGLLLHLVRDAPGDPERPAERGRGRGPRAAGVRKGLGVARSRLHRDARDGDSQHRAAGVVHPAGGAAGAAREPRRFAEPVQGALVLPRAPGDARLFRPLARRGGVPHSHHRGADGDSLHRHEPQGQRLLHLQGAEGRDRHLPVRLPDPLVPAGGFRARSCGGPTGTSSAPTSTGTSTGWSRCSTSTSPTSSG